MKKFLSMVLVVLMMGSCFAVSASARDGGYTSYTFTFPQGEESGIVLLPAETSGTYLVTISPTGSVDSFRCELVNAANDAKVTPRGAFPETVEYDLDAGESYHLKFSFTSENTGDVVIHFWVECPTGELMYCAYTVDLGCNGYLPAMLLSDGYFSLTPTVSGKYKVAISHSGAFKFYSYKIWKAVGNDVESFASHDSLPESAEYDLVAGETYGFAFLVVNTGNATIHFDVESPTGEKTRYDITPDYFPTPAGTYKVTIAHSGTFDLEEYKLWKTVDDAHFEEIASYDAFPESAKYELAEGEHLYFAFKISRNTNEAVMIRFTVEEPATYWWDALPSFVQWILKYLCFGWLWMRFF